VTNIWWWKKSEGMAFYGHDNNRYQCHTRALSTHQRPLGSSFTYSPHTRYLDIREINGYSIHTVPVHQADPTLPPIITTVYIGTPDNPQFVKDIPSAEDLARHIFNSRGPSGENREYLLHLHNAIIELHPGSRDNHIAELAEIGL
jgi:cation transport regulator ChaC